MNQQITTESFIEEIKADFRKQSDAGLIDEASIYRDIVLGLKKFGNNIAELQETVVEVENGRALLPETFLTLYIAYLCEPLGYSTKGTVEKHALQTSNVYVERVERSTQWAICDPCCETTCEKVITENVFINEGSSVNFHYHNPQLLSLGKSFNKNNCYDKCRNKYVRESPYEININKNTLHANFDKGSIYMQYYSLPQDEEGNLVIPNSFNGNLETYLEYYVKERLIERLILAGHGAGLDSMYSVISQKRSIALKNATSDLKMGSINPNRFRSRMRRLNRIETLKYSLNFNF